MLGSRIIILDDRRHSTRPTLKAAVNIVPVSFEVFKHLSAQSIPIMHLMHQRVHLRLQRDFMLLLLLILLCCLCIVRIGLIVALELVNEHVLAQKTLFFQHKISLEIFILAGGVGEH